MFLVPLWIDTALSDSEFHVCKMMHTWRPPAACPNTLPYTPQRYSSYPLSDVENAETAFLLSDFTIGYSCFLRPQRVGTYHIYFLSFFFLVCWYLGCYSVWDPSSFLWNNNPACLVFSSFCVCVCTCSYLNVFECLCVFAGGVMTAQVSRIELSISCSRNWTGWRAKKQVYGCWRPHRDLTWLILPFSAPAVSTSPSVALCRARYFTMLLLLFSPRFYLLNFQL